MSARKIMAKLRNSRWLYVAIFILGGVADALVRPHVVPVRYESFTVYPMQDGCDLRYASTKYFFGSATEFGDGGEELACNQWAKLSPTIGLQCKCRK